MAASGGVGIWVTQLATLLGAEPGKKPLIQRRLSTILVSLRLTLVLNHSSTLNFCYRTSPEIWLKDSARRTQLSTISQHALMITLRSTEDIKSAVGGVAVEPSRQDAGALG